MRLRSQPIVLRASAGERVEDDDSWRDGQTRATFPFDAEEHSRFVQQTWRNHLVTEGGLVFPVLVVRSGLRQRRTAHALVGVLLIAMGKANGLRVAIALLMIERTGQDLNLICLSLPCAISVANFAMVSLS